MILRLLALFFCFLLMACSPSEEKAASVPPSDAQKVGRVAEVCTAAPPAIVAGINFDVGFKKQIEVDYDAGGLTFARIYRSDSTWTDNTIGAFWRHNYARTLTVGGGTAEIVDGTGAVTNYTLSGSDWIPDEADTTATLVTAGSDYIYTLPDDTVETYDSDFLLRGKGVRVNCKSGLRSLGELFLLYSAVKGFKMKAVVLFLKRKDSIGWKLQFTLTPLI